jgi:signal transduction histidine kinase
MIYKFRIFLYILSLIVNGQLLAQEKVITSSSDFGLIMNLSTLTDLSDSLTILEILNNQQFTKSENKIPNFGISQHKSWVKTQITNYTKQNLFLEVSYPIFDYIAFFKVVGGKVIDSVVTGESFRFNSRGNQHKNFVFSLNLDSGQSADYYFCIYAKKLSVFPLYIFNEEQIVKRDSDNSMSNGIYFGIILVMILYNIFIFIIVRDINYAYYVLYIFFVGITQGVLNGYTFKYLWPEWTWMAQRSTTIFGALSGLGTIYFVRSFLQTNITSPKFDKLLTIFTLIYIISLIITFWGNTIWAYQLINLNAGPGSLILLVTAINIYVKYKNRTAMFFIIAWSIFLISVIVFVLKDYGVIPYNTFTISELQIGSAIVVVMLSFALADKINTYRAEKEHAQLQALQIARENERIIKEQNLFLEGRVEERTRELQKSNDELELTLTNLKQIQTQLVEQEKMASLGQLTAGIAHEINNPINFVSSNVKPLKRDMDMMIDLLNRIEQIALSDILQQQKQEQIQKIKTEYDFEYLKEEVGFLLKGIEEGAIRTADIVRGLRIFSRVDEDDLKIADIHEGIDSTLIITTNLMNGKIKLIKNYCDTQKVECYPGKLNQVFLNIISNAVYAIKQKYNDKEGGVLTITTNCDGKYFIIAITDNGCGMPDEVKNKIFEPFFTTKPVGEGTGLGMSIAITTIQRHNGSLDVTSALGEGTTFTIKIPIKQS